MLPPSRTPLAGGFLLAAAILLGVGVGLSQGQPSLGFVGGLGVGLVLLGLVWLRDRARSGRG